MEGFDREVWGEVSRAAALAGVEPDAFARDAVERAAKAALAPVSIYVLYDPRTERPRYVGRTVNPAGRMKAHRRDKDGSERAAWVAELAAVGLEPVMHVMSEVTAAEADVIEQWWIDGLRGDGHDLLNRYQVFDLPKVTVSFLPETWAWVEEYAKSRGWSPGFLVDTGVDELRKAVDRGERPAAAGEVVADAA